MGRCIVKIDDRYTEFSTVVDMVILRPMTRAQYSAYYLIEYGRRDHESAFEDRMAKADARGTSSAWHDSAEKVLANNQKRIPVAEYIEQLRKLALPTEFEVTPQNLEETWL